MLCYYFSLEVVLQGMSKNNPIEKQINAEIQVTLKHERTWKLTVECKVYRYKLQRFVNYNYLHPNIRGSHPKVFCENGVLKNFPCRFRLDYPLSFLTFLLLTLSMYLFAGKGTE